LATFVEADWDANPNRSDPAMKVEILQTTFLSLAWVVSTPVLGYHHICRPIERWAIQADAERIVTSDSAK
jgi:hypothetical protein